MVNALQEADVCQIPTNTFLLSQLEVGASAKVETLSNFSTIRQRLLDIGLTPGTKVKCLFKSPFGDPTAYEIRGAVMALRSEDASVVLVKLT